MLPAGPLAWTSKSCGPKARPVYSCGEVHGVNTPSSSTHSKVASAWSEENLKVTEVLSVWASTPMSGSTESILVSGGSVIVQAWLAGVPSTLPAPSLARTWNSCRPGARFVYSAGEVQELNAGASRAHSKLEPPSLLENLNSALLLAVGSSGPKSIVVSGGRSTVHA